MNLTKNKITFSSDKIADADYFNHNISLVRDDINNLLLQLLNLDAAAYNYVGLYNEDYIEQLRYKIERIKNQITALKYLSVNNRYSSVIQYNLDAAQSILAYNSNFYMDPKGGIFTTGSLLRIANGFLQNAIVTNASIPFDTVEFSNASTIQAVNNNNGKYDVYMLRSKPQSLSFTVDISLKSLNNVNHISFDSTSKLPFNIDKFAYFDGTNWIDYAYSRNGIFGSASINLSKINTSKIRLFITLLNCQATNLFVDLSGNQLLQEISANKIDINSLGDYNGSQSFAYYIYHFGFQNLDISLIDKSDSGVYVSAPTRLNQPAQYSLDVNVSLSDMAAEYYLRTIDFDKDGNKIANSDHLIAILPENVNTITKEVIKPIAGTKTGSSYSGSYVAFADMCFYPSGIVNVFENDIAYNNIVINGKTVYFTSLPTFSNIYTTSYQVYHSSKNFFTPAEDPLTALTFQQDYMFGEQNHVKFNPVTQLEDQLNGTDYLRLVAPYSFDPATLQISRYTNDGTTLTLDSAAPLYYLSGAQQNVFVKGRFVYVEFPVVYSKLYNATYRISASIADSAMVPTVPFYYNQDNSVIVNWEYFKNTYDSYGYTNVYLIVIARGNKVNGFYDCNISDIHLYSNKFDDLTMTVNTI